jgi:hypothetical protein
MKKALEDVDRGVFVWVMERMYFPLAARSWVFRFFDMRKASLVVDGKLSSLRKVETSILQGSPTSPLLFVTCNSDLNRRIRGTGAGVARVAGDIKIYIRSGDANKNAIKLSGILQVCH